MQRLLLSGFVGVVLGLTAGCSQPVDEESATSDAALEQQWSLSTPTIFEIEAPIDMTFTRPEDWSDLEVQDPLDPNHAWRPATTVVRPAITERQGVGSSIRDQLGNGFGSGTCRPRLNPFRREIGFKCKWTF